MPRRNVRHLAQILLLGAIVVTAGCVSAGSESTTTAATTNDTGDPDTTGVVNSSTTSNQQTTDGERTLSNKLVIKSESTEAISVNVTVEQPGEPEIDREIQLTVDGESDLSQELEFDESATVTLRFDDATEELTIADNEGDVVYVNATGVVRIEAEVA